ncbi:MAG: hypothetical protein SynsKO_31610 [Synoicihabitans sp.]
MRKFNFSLFCLLMAALALSATVVEASPLTSTERVRANAELTASAARLEGALVDLTAEQWHYQPRPDSWSIADCLEHLVVTEMAFAGMMDAMLAEKPSRANQTLRALTDLQILKQIKDRSDRFKTAEPFEPTGRFSSPQEMFETLKKHRASHQDFVRTTMENLRDRGREFPFGFADAYQAMLVLAAHCERHVQQIEEIKLSEGYPGGRLRRPESRPDRRIMR